MLHLLDECRLDAVQQATLSRILVSNKTFNIPVAAIDCSNAQNVGFENPTYKIIPSITLWNTVVFTAMAALTFLRL